MKYQVLFSLKNNEKIFKTVICCSHDWRLRGLQSCIVMDLFSLLVQTNSSMYATCYAEKI